MKTKPDSEAKVVCTKYTLEGWLSDHLSSKHQGLSHIVSSLVVNVLVKFAKHSAPLNFCSFYNGILFVSLSFTLPMSDLGLGYEPRPLFSQKPKFPARHSYGHLKFQHSEEESGESGI